MGFFDAVTDLISGASDQVQNITDAVDGITNHEAVQNLKDSASELGAKTEEVTGNLNEQAQGAIDGLKDKLNK